MPLRAILFDKDGTFVDFDRTWGPAALAVMRVLAKGDAAALDRLVAASLVDAATLRFDPASPLLAGSTADFAPIWAKAIGIKATPAFNDEIDGLFEKIGIQSLTPIGQPELAFRALRNRGLTLGVVTNDSERGAVAQVKALGIAECFSFIAGWDSGHGQKPGPGQIEAFLRLHGLQPSETIMVGDTLHDMHAARAAGVMALGVTSGLIGADAFDGHADHVLPSIMAIEGWLDQRADG
jgi:phosphoglycolate phosphatase